MLNFNDFSRIEDYIELNCQKYPEKLCVSLFGKGKWNNYTYKEFWQEVDRYTHLFSKELEQSCLILFIKNLDIDLLAAFIGAIRAGHFPAQLSTFSAKISEYEYNRKINHIIAITGAKGIFTDKAHIPELPDNKSIKVFTPDSKSMETGISRKINSEFALVQFSSGSTGLQKGVILSHKAIISHMKNYSESINLSENDKIISWLPLYHDMGLIACYLMPLMCGIPFYQIDPFDWIMSPDILLKSIEEFKATVCFLPNFAFHVLINKGKDHDLSSVRLFINCSEPARVDTHLKFLEKFPTVKPEAMTVCYALAENTFAVSQYLKEYKYGSVDIAGKKIISCGHVIPGTEVNIFDKDQDGIGEVGIKGEYLFSGFIDGSLPLREEFYLTGDLGYLSEKQELFISGRKKDILIVNGKNIYPQDIEHVISNNSGVYPGRVVAFGIISENTGSEELFVIVESNKTVDDSLLRLSVQRDIDFAVGILPKRVEITEHMTLVKTSSGKISRSRNKELYQNGELKIL